MRLNYANSFYRKDTPEDGGGVELITRQVGELKTLIQTGQQKAATDIQSVQTSVTEVKTSVDEVRSEQDELRKEINIIKAKSGRSSIIQKATDINFNDRVKELVIENREQLKAMAAGSLKSHSFRIEAKDIADTTAPNSLTGNYPKEYASEIISMPSRKVHLRQLFGVGPTSERTYTYYREKPVEGGVASQNPEGAVKSKIKFNLEEVDANVKTIAGFTVVSRQLLNNLPGMWSFLQKRMPELYYREEDRQLFSGTGLNGELPGLLAAIASGASTETELLLRLLDIIAEIEDGDEDVNTLLFRPTDYMKLLKTATLNKPDVIVIDPATGRLTVAGVPAYKSTAVPAGTGVAGDFNMGADILQLTALNVAISLEDDNNFQKNAATVRVEAEVAFPIFRPGAFRKISMTTTP